MKAQLFAATAPVFAGGIIAAARMASGKPPGFRLVVGVGFASALLSLLAAVLPGAARGFAWLLILGAVLGSGYDLFKRLGTIVS